ncbi:MAG: hypothetical protein ACLGXA_07900 [Acidobacteriota bacterium]
MKEASVRDLRYDFRKVEAMLREGYEVRITKRREVIGRLVPERTQTGGPMPDFMAQLREIYGDRVLSVTGAEIVARGRDRDDLAMPQKKAPVGRTETSWQKRRRKRSTQTAAS